jgi:hypothetical protein
MQQAPQIWHPSEEELAQILAEMQPIVVEFAQRFRRESEGRVAPVALQSAGR